MWIPLVQYNLPKTLTVKLKWVTSQSKRSRKSKSKKETNTTTTTIIVAAITAASLSILIQQQAEKEQQQKQQQNLQYRFLFGLSLIFLPLLSSAVSPTPRSIAQFLLGTVIPKLLFLMNDIRIKSFYRSTTNTTTTTIKTSSNSLKLSKSHPSPSIASTSSPSSSVSSTLASPSSPTPSPLPSSSSSAIDSKLFNCNYKNNYRTYNNSSKSNKVFLYYTPRDPRLRIFNERISLNKPLKCMSELQITEDLSNYGEFIGGKEEKLNCDLIVNIVNIRCVALNAICCDSNKTVKRNLCSGSFSIDGGDRSFFGSTKPEASSKSVDVFLNFIQAFENVKATLTIVGIML